MRISDWSSDVCSSDLGNSRTMSDTLCATSSKRAGRTRLPVRHLQRMHQKRASAFSSRSSHPRRSKRHHRQCGSKTALCPQRSEEHTSELQSLMRISYAVFCLKNKKNQIPIHKQSKAGHTKIV